MEFWLKFNNGAETLWLPVNPESVAVTSEFGFEDVDVSNLGEYALITNNRLKSFSISSFFPRNFNASYCKYVNLRKPWDCVKAVETWQKSGMPVRFIVTGTPINVAVTIRSFRCEERGGEPGDVYYTLEMKEHVFIGVTRKGNGGNSGTTGGSNASPPKATTEAQRPNTKETPSSYTVKSGDSLFKIAARTYQDGGQWRKIYTANKSAIGANPSVLKPGQKLVIPK